MFDQRKRSNSRGNPPSGQRFDTTKPPRPPGTSSKGAGKLIRRSVEPQTLRGSEHGGQPAGTTRRDGGDSVPPPTESLLSQYLLKANEQPAPRLHSIDECPGDGPGCGDMDGARVSARWTDTSFGQDGGREARTPTRDACLPLPGTGKQSGPAQQYNVVGRDLPLLELDVRAATQRLTVPSRSGTKSSSKTGHPTPDGYERCAREANRNTPPKELRGGASRGALDGLDTSHHTISENALVAL